MSYEIDHIACIGASELARLHTAEIRTTDDLLSRCGDPEGRTAVARYTGIGEEEILRWVHKADLMRVSGIGGTYAALLEGSGVDTLQELRRREPARLAAAMRAFNQERRYARNFPAVELVEKWIAQAREMEPAVEP